MLNHVVSVVNNDRKFKAQGLEEVASAELQLSFQPPHSGHPSICSVPSEAPGVASYADGTAEP